MSSTARIVARVLRRVKNPFPISYKLVDRLHGKRR